MTNNNFQIEESSYKDKSAQVGFLDNKIVRKINKSYFETYDFFINSGLYNALLEKNLIIPHTKLEENEEFIIIEPEEIFISYPWEWSFAMLKDCALATLEIQKIALKFNMSLKDANFFNIQFKNNKPLLIDTTSFEKYEENSPWCAYQQYCKNFLAPLLLMSKKDLKLQGLLLQDLSGIDLELTSKLLPLSSWLDFDILSNIHLHSMFIKNYSQTNKKINNKLSKKQLLNFIDSLIFATKKINLKNQKTQWGKYYDFTNYNNDSFEDKKRKVLKLSSQINPRLVVDFGANTGEFSRLFKDSKVFSLDFDKLAINENYKICKNENLENIQPLLFDIMNPSSNLGFLNSERKDLFSRIKNVDLSLALALIHHLRIGNNLPFELIAKFFSQISKYLIIEFIDKTDSKVQQLLLNRKDIFDDYSIDNFQNEFSKYYKILKKEKIDFSKRTLFLMEKYE